MLIIQTAEFMSPPRWLVGHVWFFEDGAAKFQPGYRLTRRFLFSPILTLRRGSARIERPKRGTRSRPTVRETRQYRAHIDEQMTRFIEQVSDRDDAEEILSIVRLGLEHEMQHQELLVYDIKHLLCDQFDAPMKSAPPSVETVSGMAESKVSCSSSVLVKAATNHLASTFRLGQRRCNSLSGRLRDRSGAGQWTPWVRTPAAIGIFAGGIRRLGESNDGTVASTAFGNS